jgi:hypothetical protein
LFYQAAEQLLQRLRAEGAAMLLMAPTVAELAF